MSACRSKTLFLLLTFVALWAPMEEADVQQTTTPQTGGASKNPNDLNVSGILDSLLRGYDKRIRPNYGGPRVDVGITMFILSVRDMSEERMDFTMDFYFRQFWKDNRLGFVAKNGVDSLSVGAELAKNIWVPDTFFANEKSAYFHEATTSNSFLRISSTGDISRSIRLTVTATCPMNLQYFPMDRQLCTIEIESFGYTMRDIRYKWNAGENSIGISTEVQLPQFRVVGHRQKTKEIILTTGNYSRLACEIQFVRSMGYYLIQIYIPSSLIVVISWVSFWLNRNATPARVSLGVTTVLTMTTLMSSTNAALPKISYVKSIDIFLGTCFVMVFASLLEYATVGYLGKRIQMRKTRFQNLQKLAEQRKPVLPPTGEANHTDNPGGPPMEPPIPLSRFPMEHQRNCPYGNGSSDGRKKTPDPKDPRHGRLTPLLLDPVPPAAASGGGGGGDAEAGGGGGGGDNLPKKINRLCGMSPSDIDKYSRVVFPVCFVCFNLMYWIIYLHISDVMAEDLIPLAPA